ncbi:hypothetical protein LGK95_15855 [Clostridium algoriphilum]|uniref:hypothetical protein n=1 Tax=Clostridium algoriphilum TaxID=198347 RepID=UPI001CF49FF5|nr:hypothetical protein [Clostridium algoriphilum]MCB2294962.1 hypothetical protein [Clostridium algoriphilum]
MGSIIKTNYTHLEDIQFNIHDSEVSYYGGSQYWFPKKFNQLSGCGPVVAANITAYLSQTFTDKYYNLYPYNGIVNKKDFTLHMIEIRKYVKPGIFGLTSVNKFSDAVLAFSKNRGVSLTSHILDEKADSIQEAIDFILEGLSQRIPVAILVLKHQNKDFKEYTWHWMTITGLNLNSQSNKCFISVSTYGEHREINLDLLWNQRRLKDIIRLAYFT